MITIRPQDQRGIAKFNWLDSRHSFSFGNYYDPQHMGFASLRVINEDKIIPAEGFGTHGHQDMEIITCVLSGELEHRDSMGNGSIIRPGDVQRMTAGTGVRHSEFNASATEPVHLLQIWILPEERGLEPSYEEKNFSSEIKQGKLTLLGSQDGKDNSVTIHQDVNLYLGSLTKSDCPKGLAESKGLASQSRRAPRTSKADRLTYQIKDNRAIWLQVATGEVKLNERLLQAGDGVAITDETEIVIAANSLESQFLLFDMAR